MTKRLRFHLDEHVNPDIALSLHRYGIDVTTTIDAKLRGQSDREQLAFAQREQRVLVTHDTDFLRLVTKDVDHFGIAYCHQTNRTIGEIVEHLILMYEVLTVQEMTGKVEYL